MPSVTNHESCDRIADQDLLGTKDRARVYIGATGSPGTASWCQHRIFVNERKGDIV
jgi:hypothetical protein